MEDSLKEKTISGMIWTFIGQVGTLGLSFISNLILARILMPDDFGCIAMLNVFVNIADICIQGGFGLALIQKKNTTQVDYSSVFFCNLIISVIAYLLLFAFSPAIASFYELPKLSLLLKVQSIQLLIGALAIVQSAQLKKSLKFKELSIRSMLAAAIGLIVGLILALKGYGVWSLVASSTTAEFVKLVLLWKMVPWTPTFKISLTSLKELFGFGGLMMLSSIVTTVYDNLQNLLIGKFFNATSLGLVSQAKKLESVPAGALSTVVDQVSFPVFSCIQDDTSKLLSGISRNIKCIQFINLPMMTLFIIIAKPLILLLYGAKWEGCVVFFQILCVSRFVSVLDPINTSVWRAIGRSKLFFVALCIKLTFSIVLIVIGIYYGIYGLLVALAVSPYINFIVDAIINEKILSYGISKQIKDFCFPALSSLFIGTIVYSFSYVLNINQVLLMLMQCLCFLLLYYFVAKIRKDDTLIIYENILIQRLKKR